MLVSDNRWARIQDVWSLVTALVHQGAGLLLKCS